MAEASWAKAHRTADQNLNHFSSQVSPRFATSSSPALQSSDAMQAVLLPTCGTRQNAVKNLSSTHNLKLNVLNSAVLPKHQNINPERIDCRERHPPKKNLTAMQVTRCLLLSRMTVSKPSVRISPASREPSSSARHRMGCKFKGCCGTMCYNYIGTNFQASV